MVNMIKTVIKKDGSKETFQRWKCEKWASWADKFGVDWNEVVTDSLDSLYDNVKTSEIQIAMIKNCVYRQTEKYSAMAARLLVGHIYSEIGLSVVDAENRAISFKSRYYELVKRGSWKALPYNKEQCIIDILDKEIDYSYDLNYNYSSLKQWHDKIALKDINTGRAVESFQESLIRVAMYNLDNVEDIIAFYTYSKNQYINIATPVITSSGTGENAQASCCVIKAGDTKESIIIGNALIYLMTANRAGIGYELNSRSENDIVGNNKCKHGGKLPIFNTVVMSAKSVSQGSRGGSVTTTFNSLDPELFTLLNLKFPTTVAEKRIENMDYSMSVRYEFLRRVAKNEDWVLVSLKDEPELYHHYFNSFGDNEYLFIDRINEVFELVQQGRLKGKIVKAREIFDLWLKARVETGKMYITCLDNINIHTPFNGPISQSNLCQEICLPTNPYYSFDELLKEYEIGNGLTSLCFLSAMDVAKIPNDDIYKDCCYITSKLLDNIITNLDYPFENIKSSNNFYRNIGVGMTNLAYELAKKGYKYSNQEGKNHIAYLSERHLFFMLLASTRLAKERGKCGYFDYSKYKGGVLPIDTYNRNIDNVVKLDYAYDWNLVRNEIFSNGLRFSTHVAHMPCESSSLLGYSTNGLYPIRNGEILKKRSEGNLLFIAPEWEKLKDNYEIAWDIDTKDIYEMYGIVQKFTDQGISADDYINYNSDKVSQDKLTGDILYGMKIGLKTLYYCNSKTNTGGDNIKLYEEKFKINLDDFSGKTCEITQSDDEDGCDVCKL